MLEHYKKIFSVPVSTDSIEAFNHRECSDPHHQDKVTNQIGEFIAVSIKKHGYLLPVDFCMELSEVIYNSYDAYSKQGLEQGKSLDFTIKIFVDDDKALVKIKDNAGGFLDKPLGAVFEAKDIKPEAKDGNMYSGGTGLGLQDFTKMLTDNNIHVFFSNRKNTPGASVNMEFTRIHK